MKLWHITLSSADRQVLFPDEPRRRAAVWVLARVAGQRLLLFCIVDDHVHVVVACAAAELRHVRGALVRAIGRAAGRPVVAHVKPVESRAHLRRIVSYLLRQVAHHGLAAHPARWSGSCFRDLVGARCVAPLSSRFAPILPRAREDELWSMVGLPPLAPANDTAVRRAGPHAIVSAAAAALAVGPTLSGGTQPVVAARRLAAQLAAAVGLPTSTVAEALSLTPQRVGQLRTQPAGADQLRAARLTLAIEEHLVVTQRAAG